MAIEEDTARPRGRLNTAYWLLLTVLLGLPLITPLLRWSSVACTHDGHLHYHRVAAMAHAWENGIYLTRWLPDLAFGYGYPFFVYREAAPLYAVLLPFLAGLPLPAASNLFYAVTILLSGVFMFLWVRDIFGPRAGLVSAVAYMAAPYVLVDALIRGNAPESLALPLFPFLLWVGRRWVLHGSVWSFIGGVLGLALLSIGHNISTFIFAPTLLVYLGALTLSDRRPPTADPRSSELITRHSSLVTRRLFRLGCLAAGSRRAVRTGVDQRQRYQDARAAAAHLADGPRRGAVPVYGVARFALAVGSPAVDRFCPVSMAIRRPRGPTGGLSGRCAVLLV